LIPQAFNPIANDRLLSVTLLHGSASDIKMYNNTQLSDSATEVGSIIGEPTTSMSRQVLNDRDARRLGIKAIVIVEELYVTPKDKLDEQKPHHLTWLINTGVQEDLAEQTVEICSRAIRTNNLENASVCVFMWLLGLVFPFDCKLKYAKLLKTKVNTMLGFQQIPPKGVFSVASKRASKKASKYASKDEVDATAKESVKETANIIAGSVSKHRTRGATGHTAMIAFKSPANKVSNSGQEQGHHSKRKEALVSIPSPYQREPHSDTDNAGQQKIESDQLRHPSETETASENSAATGAGHGTISNQDNSNQNLCFQCQKPASKICPACVLDGDESSKVWYCSTTCQKEHRTTHKSDCDLKCDQKALTRIATILQMVWNQFNDNTCSDRLHNIFHKNGILVFDASQDERHALVGDFIFQAPLANFYAKEDYKRIHQNFYSAMGIREWFSKLIISLLERKVSLFCP
jgi:hypothetical protein